jgi:hypothetical protein
MRRVPKSKRAKTKGTAITAQDLRPVAAQSKRRPPSSRPPVSARVDIVVADLRKDPRRDQ